MIPKIIHYCWFGGKPFPKLVKKCIRSWHKYCQNYIFIEWNEKTFDIESNQFVKEAYERKKWAFVTDYVRLYAIFNYGGVYMDTDVELLKPIDSFLECEGFTGFESNDLMVTAIMGGVKGNKLYKLLLNYYSNKHFNEITNTQIITSQLREFGFVPNNTLQEIDGFYLYPSDYFCPKSYTDGIVYLSNNSVSIHHFSGSWQNKTLHKQLKKEQIKVRFRRKLPLLYNFIKCIFDKKK